MVWKSKIKLLDRFPWVLVESCNKSLLQMLFISLVNAASHLFSVPCVAGGGRRTRTSQPAASSPAGGHCAAVHGPPAPRHRAADLHAQQHDPPGPLSGLASGEPQQRSIFPEYICVFLDLKSSFAMWVTWFLFFFTLRAFLFQLRKETFNLNGDHVRTPRWNSVSDVACFPFTVSDPSRCNQRAWNLHSSPPVIWICLSAKRRLRTFNSALYSFFFFFFCILLLALFLFVQRFTGRSPLQTRGC